MMIKPFRVDVPIFRMSILTCANCTPSEACEAFYGYKGKHSILDPRESDAWVQIYKGDIFVWIRDTDYASTVFHELVPVAYAICDVKGMAFDEKLIAYLVGWLKLSVADKLFKLGGAE